MRNTLNQFNNDDVNDDDVNDDDVNDDDVNKIIKKFDR